MRLNLNSAIILLLCVLSLLPSNTFAQFDPTLTLRSDNINKLPITLDWLNRQYLHSDATDAGINFGWFDGETSISVPLIGKDGDYDISAKAGYRELIFHGQPLLGTPARKFPDNIYDPTFSLTGRKLTNNGLFGLSASVGSASDRPFASWDETSVYAGSWWTVQTSRQHSWQLMLYYDSRSNIAGGMPLPGAAWIYTPSRDFTLTVGLPACSVIYKPTDKLELFALATVMNSAKAKISYEFTEQFKLYTGFDWISDSFYLHDRPDNDDSLYLRQSTADIGIRFDITECIYIDLNGGWSFDRYWFEGEDYGDRHDNRIDLDDTAFVGLTASISF